MKKLLLVSLAAVVLGGCNRLDNHQPLTSHKLYFTKVNDLSQTFLSRRENLNIVSICLRNPDRTLIPLQFELTDEEGVTVRSLNFTGGNIDNSDCTKFQFEPVSDSKGKTYTAHIVVQLDDSLEPRTAEGLRSGLYAEAHGGGDYLAGVAMLDGVATDYDLHFKTHYRQDIREILKESLSSLGSRLTADPLFMFIYLIVLAWVVIKIWRTK